MKRKGRWFVWVEIEPRRGCSCSGVGEKDGLGYTQGSHERDWGSLLARFGEDEDGV